MKDGWEKVIGPESMGISTPLTFHWHSQSQIWNYTPTIKIHYEIVNGPNHLVSR